MLAARDQYERIREVVALRHLTATDQVPQTAPAQRPLPHLKVGRCTPPRNPTPRHRRPGSVTTTTTMPTTSTASPPTASRARRSPPSTPRRHPTQQQTMPQVTTAITDIGHVGTCAFVRRSPDCPLGAIHRAA
jgi:hypothetical protein